MIAYEFLFRDGTRLTGEGEGEAEALLDAYRRNGFLPFVEIIEKTVISDPDITKPPEAVTGKRRKN